MGSAPVLVEAMSRVLCGTDGQPVRVVGPGAPIPPGWRTEASFVAVPNLAQARILISCETGAAGRARLLREYNDLRYSWARWGRSALALSLSAQDRVRPFDPMRVLVPDDDVAEDPPLTAHVAALLGRSPDDIALSIPVRRAAGGVRPMVQVADRLGQPLAFAKISDNWLHHQRLAAEHQALVELAALGRRMTFMTPAPLHFGSWRGRKMLLVEPLPRQVRRVRLTHDRLTWPALDQIATSEPGQVGPVAGSAWEAHQRQRIAVLGQDGHEELSTLLNQIVTAAGDREYAHARLHGDWSAWNLGRLPDGRLAVWDWEFSMRHAPVGLDRLNWHFQLQTSGRRVPVQRAAQRLIRAAARTPDLRSDLIPLLFLDFAIRRAEEAAVDPSATPLAREVRLIAHHVTGAAGRR